MIVTEIKDYPPYEFLVLVANNCPKAIAVYLKIWKLRDSNLKLVVSTEEICQIWHESIKSLNANLHLLAKLGVIDFTYNKDYYDIKLLTPEDV